MKKLFYIVTAASLIFITAHVYPNKNFEMSTRSSLNDREYNTLGFIHLKKRKYILAEKYFKKAIKLNPYKKYYYNNLSVVYIKLGKYKKAYRYLRKAIFLDKSYVKAISNIAIVCFYLGRYREAYSYYRKAKRVNKSYVSKRFKREKMKNKLNNLHKETNNQKYLDMKKYLDK